MSPANAYLEVPEAIRFVHGIYYTKMPREGNICAVTNCRTKVYTHDNKIDNNKIELKPFNNKLTSKYVKRICNFTLQ